jgi:transposase
MLIYSLLIYSSIFVKRQNYELNETGLFTRIRHNFMAQPAQTTKARLLKLLLEMQAAQPNTPVKFQELAKMIGITPQRIGQLYRELAVDYTLPPAIKTFRDVQSYPSQHSTKVRLLKLLQYSLATQPNTPVSLNELGKTLHISRERVRQLYRQLAVKYTLPPVKKRGMEIGGTNRHLQVMKAEHWALAQQVKALREQRMSYAQIQQKLGISRNQVNSAITRLNRSGDTVHRFQTPSPKTLALEAEVRAYSDQGLTAAEIARKIGRPVPTIYTVLQRLDIPFNRARRPKRPITLALEAEVRACRTQGMTPPEIAQRTGRRVQSIHRVLRRLGMPFKRVRHRRKSQKTVALEATVRTYIKQDMSVPEIARKIGRPAPTIYNVLYRLHIPFNRAKDTGRRLRNPKTLALEAEVRKYSEQGLTAPEIAKRTGRNESTIQRVHHRLHIPLQRRRKSQETVALETKVRKYSEQGLTVAEIAKRTGRPGRTIYEVLRRLGIPRNLIGNAVYSGISPQVLALEAEVRAYSDQGLTTAEIARKTGRHLQTIYNVLHRLDIPFNRARRPKSSQVVALEAKVRTYSEQGMTPLEIARKIGRPRTSIYNIFYRLHIPFSKQSRSSG